MHPRRASRRRRIETVAFALCSDGLRNGRAVDLRISGANDAIAPISRPSSAQLPSAQTDTLRSVEQASPSPAPAAPDQLRRLRQARGRPCTNISIGPLGGGRSLLQRRLRRRGRCARKLANPLVYRPLPPDRPPPQLSWRARIMPQPPLGGEAVRSAIFTRRIRGLLLEPVFHFARLLVQALAHVEDHVVPRNSSDPEILAGAAGPCSCTLVGALLRAVRSDDGLSRAVRLIFYSWRPHAGLKSLILLDRGDGFAKM